MEKLSRRKVLSWLGLGGAAATAGAGAVVLSNNAAAAAADDELRRQMAKLQLGIMTPISKTTALESIGLDWRKEAERLEEETRLAQYDPLEDLLIVVQATYARLDAAGVTFAPRGVTIPFATHPISFYIRTPPFEADEEANLKPHFQSMLQDIRRGNFAPLIKLTQRLYEEQKRQDLERADQLTKADMADRIWSPRLHIDIDELNASRLFYAIVLMGMAPVWEAEERLEQAQEFAKQHLGRPGTLTTFKDTALKLMIKQEGPILEMASYNEMAGKLA